ncbi:hypothetical protein BAY06_13460 [Elizabethkingia anophelis]|nr:hypothetical protein BAY06_13460 [Elizabethkingia anophelis]
MPKIAEVNKNKVNMKHIYFCLCFFFSIYIIGGERSSHYYSRFAYTLNISELFTSLFSNESSSYTKITEADKLLQFSDAYFYKDTSKSMMYAQKARLIAEEIDDSKRKVESYYYIARGLFFFRQLEEGYLYIEKGMNEEVVKKDVFYKALFINLKAIYHGKISLAQKQLEGAQKALDLISSKKNLNSKLLSSQLYMLMADAYTEMYNDQKAHFYADQSIRSIEKIPEQEYLQAQKIYYCKAYIYFYKAWLYLKQDQSDLAFPFIQKAYNGALKEEQGYMAPFLEIYGDYYQQTKNYSKAIDYYLQAIGNKKKFRQTPEYVQSKVAAAYNMLGKYDKESLYLKESSDMLKLNIEKDKVHLQRELQNIQQDYNTEKSKDKIQNAIIFVFIILCYVFVLLLFLFKYRKIKEKKRRVSEEKEKLLIHKRSIIAEKENIIETLRLQQEGNQFSELIEMAKENSPQFWFRFHELYPEMYGKMIKINPNIKVPELTFCAYLYLGFSTKDIAEYTFVTVRAVETRKSRLREKYSIPSGIDFYNWIREL